MSQVNKHSTPAERHLGCHWADRFLSATDIEKNRGTISGSPTYGRGFVLDGSSDYVTYDVEPSIFNNVTISIVVEFVPHFAVTDDTTVHWLDTGSNRFSVLKRNNAGSNELRVILGGTTIADISAATWGAAFVQGQRNVLVVSSTSGDTNAWLNGTKILDADPTAWSGSRETSFTVGAQSGGGNSFPGEIISLKIFGGTALGELDAELYYTGNHASYRHESICYLPMDAAHHDATAGLALDASGHGNHFTIGTGSAAPTKLTSTRGYRFGGNDYLERAMFFDPNADFTYAILCVDNNRSTHYPLSYRDGAGDGVYISRLIPGTVYFVYNSSAASVSGDNFFLNSYVGVFDVSGDVSGYAGGILRGTDDISGETIDVTYPNIRLGAKTYTTSTWWNGGIFAFQVWQKLLSPLQVADWHLRAMREISLV